MQSVLKENGNDFSLVGPRVNGVQTQPVHQSTCQSQPALRQIQEEGGGGLRVCLCGHEGVCVMGRGHSEEWKDQKLEGKHVSDHLLR